MAEPCRSVLTGKGNQYDRFGSFQQHYISRKAPRFIGKYILENGQVTFVPEPGVEVTTDGKTAGPTAVKTDKTSHPTLLENGSLAWFIIERGDQYGIRLRDYEYPALAGFQGIESFPVDPAWKIRARFETFTEPRELLIPTVIGTLEKNTCPGLLRFEINGVEQKLYPTDAGR